MSLPATITPAILDTVVAHLAPHFLTSTEGDISVARDAAESMIAAYNVDTDEQLHLAAAIVSFGFHALETLSQATTPDLSLNKILRLRGSAVSLSREAHKAQRKLDQLQRARLVVDAKTQVTAPQAAAPHAPVPVTAAIQAPPPPKIPEQPATDPAPGLIELAREALEASSKKGFQAWTMSRQQRRAAERITENLKRNQAEQALREAANAAATQTDCSDHQTSM